MSPVAHRKHPNQVVLFLNLILRIFFIVGGAFDGIEDTIKQATLLGGIGFGQNNKAIDDDHHTCRKLR